MFAPWLLVAATLADAPPVPCYHRDGVHLGLPQGITDVSLRDLLREELKQREVPRLVLVQPGEADRELKGLYGVARLNRKATLGCLSVLIHDLRGAEVDQVFGSWGGAKVPVTTWWESDGTLRVQPGEPGYEAFPDGPPAETLVARYGLAPSRRETGPGVPPPWACSTRPSPASPKPSWPGSATCPSAATAPPRACRRT